MLEINSSLFIQIANFLFLLFVLNLILYKPIRKILTQRNEKTSSLEKTIRDYQERSEQNERGIEDGMIKARKEGFLEKEKFKGQGLEGERGILQEAGASIEEKKEAAEQELESKMTEVREALEREIAGFSKELAEKILGRGIQ